MTNKANSTGTKKISTFLLAAIYLILILAVVAILVGLGTFYETGNLELVGWLLAIGFIAMALAVYYLFQSRKHVANLKIDAPKILTIIECKACNGKETREFKRGDYVFKDAEKCPKCGSLGMIVAIYREATQKEQKEKDKQINV
jgi:hypothetical protein